MVFRSKVPRFVRTYTLGSNNPLGSKNKLPAASRSVTSMVTALMPSMEPLELDTSIVLFARSGNALALTISKLAPVPPLIWKAPSGINPRNAENS